MEKPSIKIDIRGMEKVSERPKKGSKELDRIKKGNYAEIVANDERILKPAPKIIKSGGKAKFSRS